MNPITAFIKKYPQGAFWGIAYLISAGGYILNRLYPNDMWILILWGIFLGGALVTGIADGRAALKMYFNRLVRWRAGIQWYMVALFTPLVLGLISVGLTLLLGGKVSADFAFPEPGQVVFFFLLSFFTIALGEEPGFRGFALPRFLRGSSAFTASLILGVLHAIWHLPLVIGGEEALIFLLNPLFAAVLFTWVFNHTNGSVLIAMLLHASSDLNAALFGPMFSGADSNTARLFLAGGFVALAILLRMFAGRELGGRLNTEPEARMVEQAAGVD